MTGEYPILMSKEQLGTLRISKEGLMTVFEAECRDPGQLLRLSVYGECEAYLGVMMPADSGMLRLKKRLSRNALRDFPQTIRYAGPARESLPEPEKREEDARNTALKENQPEMDSLPMNADLDLCEEAVKDRVEACLAEEASSTAVETASAPEEISLEEEDYCLADNAEDSFVPLLTEPECEKENLNSPEEKTDENPMDIRWRTGAGGALVGSCGETRFLAVPLKAGTIPVWEHYQRRRINQLDYAVFEIKNGKII